jgi:hypothetical protein
MLNGDCTLIFSFEQAEDIYIYIYIYITMLRYEINFDVIQCLI